MSSCLEPHLPGTLAWVAANITNSCSGELNADSWAPLQIFQIDKKGEAQKSAFLTSAHELIFMYS